MKRIIALIMIIALVLASRKTDVLYRGKRIKIRRESFTEAKFRKALSLLISISDTLNGVSRQPSRLIFIKAFLKLPHILEATNHIHREKSGSSCLSPYKLPHLSTHSVQDR